MYRKYYEVWKEHSDRYGPRTALLYQVGGFFEIYDTENLTTGTTQANIREIAELCQLSLTVHPIEGTDMQTLFGGFPEHALGKFERVMVQAGFTVVVVVQKKGKSGAVEERVVDHIASPGCYVDTNGIKERRLVGCILESLNDGPAALRRVYWAACALDIATGRIWFVEGCDRDRLHQFLCIHPPTELVVWSDGLPAANTLYESLKGACGSVHLRCMSPASVALEESALEKIWPNSRKRLTWIHTLPQARRCLAALMGFAADHVPSALKNIAVPEAWVPDGEVRLGNAALEQLGLISLKSENDKQCLLGLMDQCRSVAGRRLLRTRLMRPITDIAMLEGRLDRIDATGTATDGQVAATERGLRSLYDISRLFRKLELGTSGLNDMACLLRSYDSARGLLTAWNGSACEAPRTAELLGFLDWVFSVWNLSATTELAREGVSVPVASLPWISGFDAEVEAQFAIGLAIRAEAEALCGQWSELGKGEKLYLCDAEGGGFRITGTKRRINSVLAVLRDEGDKSAVITPYKSTAMLETAGLEAISKRHRDWWVKWGAVWYSTWSAACATLVERGREMSGIIEQWCADLDVSWTVARIAREWLWKRPTFVAGADQSFIETTNMRHPILERLQTQTQYVSHSIALGSTSGVGMLLYGMNASGKSSLMKAVGLCALLAQCGFPVPATACRISPFTSIFTRILGNDNLWAGLSSFAVEMTEFREILRFADEHSLVLGDELCSGTESLSATALVAAGVETLTQRRAKFIFATHLHELAALPDIAELTGVKAVHLKVHYDAATDRLIYDRQLAPGSGSALYGLEVCRALDLPAGYLERATAHRKTLAGWQAPQQSSYSTAAVMDVCAVCGSSAKIEMHHIRPQKDATAAAAEGVDIHAAGNLACLCAVCHDDLHGGRLTISGWQETSAGRRLVWEKQTDAVAVQRDEINAWIREQRRHKIRTATIQRMAEQIFHVKLTDKEIKGLKL